jgi:hypothetical protein
VSQKGVGSIGSQPKTIDMVFAVPPIGGLFFLEWADNEHNSLLMTISSQGNCGTFIPPLKAFPRNATAFLGLG